MGPLASLVGLLSPRMWKFLGITLAIGIVVWMVWALLDNMTDKAYAQGKSDGVTEERNRWVAAEEAYKKKTAVAKTVADRDAANREYEYETKAKKEREEVNEAISEGRSPLDVLFPSGL